MKLCLFAAFILGSLICPRAGIAQGIDPNTSLQTEVINDPSLGNKKAFTVMTPSGWHFQGTVIAAIGCNLPSPVFRAYSPDGLTEIRLLPSFDWQEQEKKASSWEGLGAGHNCIYLNGSMTAAQFLDRYVQTLGPAHVAGPMSISTQYRQQLDDLVGKMNAINSKDPKQSLHATGDAAALRIETANGTFTIEQRLRVRVVCILWPKPIAGKLGSCSARLDVLRAPKGQLDALVSLVDSHNLTTAKNDDLWLAEVIAEIRGDRKHFDPPVPNYHALAMLYRQAHDFGLTRLYDIQREVERDTEPERNTETVVRPLHTWAIGKATSSNATYDWADFALDPEPMTDEEGVVHLSEPVRTWSSSSGQRYQIRNPGANPNGVLAGNWIETKKITSSPQ